MSQAATIAKGRKCRAAIINLPAIFLIKVGGWDPPAIGQCALSPHTRAYALLERSI